MLSDQICSLFSFWLLIKATSAILFVTHDRRGFMTCMQLSTSNLIGHASPKLGLIIFLYINPVWWKLINWGNINLKSLKF